MSKEKKAKLVSMYKPDGREVKVNELSIEYASSIGWTKEKPKGKGGD